jgi:hypothetical protein
MSMEAWRISFCWTLDDMVRRGSTSAGGERFESSFQATLPSEGIVNPANDLERQRVPSSSRPESRAALLDS